MELYEAVNLQIEKHIQYITKQLIQGNLPYEEYKYLCGQIEGLLIAVRINTEISERNHERNSNATA